MHKVMYPVIKDEHLLLNVYVYNSSVQYQYTCKHVVVLLADNLYNSATTPHVHVLLIVAMSWRVCVHLQYAVVTYVSLFISLALLTEHVIHLCPPPGVGYSCSIGTPTWTTRSHSSSQEYWWRVARNRWPLRNQRETQIPAKRWGLAWLKVPFLC